MGKNKVVPISAGVPGSKRQRVRVRVSKGAGIQIKAALVPDDVPTVATEAGGDAAADGERKYWIASDHTVGVLVPEAAEPPDAAVVFSGFEELVQKTAEWPMRQFVSVWNQLPDNAPVSRFENRRVAVTRLWQAIQKLKDMTARTEQDKPKRASKTKCVIRLLQAPGGVTLAALMKATGWQAHSVRGFLSGKVSKQLGLPVASCRRDGERVYQLPVLVNDSVSEKQEK